MVFSALIRFIQDIRFDLEFHLLIAPLKYDYFLLSFLSLLDSNGMDTCYTKKVKPQAGHASFKEKPVGAPAVISYSFLTVR